MIGMSEYLTEAVAGRKTGKYANDSIIDSLSLKSEAEDFIEAFRKLGIQEVDNFISIDKDFGGDVRLSTSDYLTTYESVYYEIIVNPGNDIRRVYKITFRKEQSGGKYVPFGSVDSIEIYKNGSAVPSIFLAERTMKKALEEMKNTLKEIVQ